ncbi:MAG: hypothetical protein COA79_04945 [Planctomycetota bacterium]|nr:MAG: hypothetical protein COA79_04945 [Planctomycetota bacterium]
MNQLLVVDDDKRIRQIIKKYFTSLGHMVDDVENGLLAVEIVKANPNKYEVIIMDMMMPEMNGLEAFEEIQTFNLSIPVIMTTAFGNVTLGVEFMKLGGSDFIEKPISMEILAIKVKQAIEIRLLKESFQSEKISRQAILESNKLKRDFLSKITHEFRTPIHSILNFSKFGLNSDSMEKIHDYFGNIHQSGDRLLELMDGLLNYSKMETDIVSFDIKREDICDVLSNAFVEYKGVQGEGHFEFEILNLMEQSVTHFDVKRLKQSFIRIFDNLHKFDPSNNNVYAVLKATTITLGNDESDFVTLPAIQLNIAKINETVEKGQVDHTLELFKNNNSANSSIIPEEFGIKIYENILKAHRGSLEIIHMPGKGILFEISLPLTK